MPPPAYLTFSIDDGHPTDLRAADILRKYNLKATFYIPAKNRERALMSKSEIRSLAQDFEVGAHTYNHVQLPQLSTDSIRKEITDGKRWLEDVVGDEVASFCYPRGKFSSKVVKIASECGFEGARTCQFNIIDFPRNPFVWGVSTHAYSHTFFIQCRHAIIEHNYIGLVNYLSFLNGVSLWTDHFLLSAKTVARRGGISHLFFHSWEIDRHQEWQNLNRVLSIVAQEPRLSSVENGDVFRLWRKQKNG